MKSLTGQTLRADVRRITTLRQFPNRQAGGARRWQTPSPDASSIKRMCAAGRRFGRRVAHHRPRHCTAVGDWEKRRAPACEGSAPMSIVRFSRDLAFDPEHIQVMLTAFDAACAKLRLRRGDKMTDRVALKTVDLARAADGTRTDSSPLCLGSSDQQRGRIDCRGPGERWKIER
jgi:hypothetical protein